jgi:ATP-dependent DNA helicase RecG
MREEARRHGCPAPRFVADGFFTAAFRPLPGSRITGHVAGHVTGDDGTKTPAEVPEQVRRLLTLLVEQGPMGRPEAQAALKLTSRANFRRRYLEPALTEGLVEMTVPDRPKSRAQRYRITPAGVAALAGQGPAAEK